MNCNWLRSPKPISNWLQPITIDLSQFPNWLKPISNWLKPISKLASVTEANLPNWLRQGIHLVKTSIMADNASDASSLEDAGRLALAEEMMNVGLGIERKHEG